MFPNARASFDSAHTRLRLYPEFCSNLLDSNASESSVHEENYSGELLLHRLSKSTSNEPCQTGPKI